MNIYTWYHNNVEGGFLGTPLQDTLAAGKKYDVTFYLSHMDSMWYAGRNIGAHFSTGQPNGNIDHLLSLVPQMRYDGDFLTDKEGWMEVSGSFIAQGGEDHITIGNYDGHYESDTIFVDGGLAPPNLPHYWKAAAYFIDDVSVVEDRNIGIGEASISHFNVYPNPAHDLVSVDIHAADETSFSFILWGVAGNQVHSTILKEGKNSIDIAHLPSGIYFYTVNQNGTSMLNDKLVILK